MKTTVKLKFRASRRVPGRGVLTLLVTRRRITRATTTSCVLSSDEWDENGQKIVFPAHIPSKRKRELTAIGRKLKKDLKEFHETAKLLEARGDYSSLELLKLFRERQQGQMFCAYIFGKVQSLQQEERFGTAHAYQYAAVSFMSFLGGKDIRMDKINVALMEEYERYLLANDKSRNTVSCYMRSLRAVYNLAIREKIFVVKKAKDNPFSGVFTGNAKTRKRAIGGKSIARLAELKLPEVKGNNRELPEVTGSNSLSFSRDLFLFSFYTQGMSFTDMVNLKNDNIKENFIRYNRKKTGQQINIELEDCMKEIIKRYQDKDSEFVFPILRDLKHSDDSSFRYMKQPKQSIEIWKKTANALAVYNKNLKKLADWAGISEHLTSYVSRHSWATMASQEGIPVATISRGLGHESEKTTRIYISLADYSDVGQANRKILSRISPPDI